MPSWRFFQIKIWLRIFRALRVKKNFANSKPRFHPKKSAKAYPKKILQSTGVPPESLGRDRILSGVRLLPYELVYSFEPEFIVMVRFMEFSVFSPS
jgi:hypothetical protein